MTQPPGPPNQPDPWNQPGQLPNQPGQSPNQPPPGLPSQPGPWNQPGQLPNQSGPQGQPPFPPYQPVPPKRSRGPLLIVGGLALLLVVLVVTGLLLLIANRGDGKPTANESTPAARTKPSDPKAVEFRRVTATKPGPCPTPAPSGTACDDKGMSYTLGKVELDGSNVAEVKAAVLEGSPGTWGVALNLDPVGTKLFGQLTASLAKQAPPANQLAIVVHGKVVTAPAVRDAIPGGKIQLSGGYTRESAEQLAAKIIG